LASALTTFAADLQNPVSASNDFEVDMIEHEQLLERNASTTEFAVLNEVQFGGTVKQRFVSFGNNTDRSWDVTLLLVSPDSCFAIMSRLSTYKVAVALSCFPIRNLVHSLLQLQQNANFSKAFIVKC
jgi:hypothetical protein